MSSVTADRTPENTSMASGDEISALSTLRQGFHYSPELREGLAVTLLLALLGTAGRVVVPITVQQTLDCFKAARANACAAFEDSGACGKLFAAAGQCQ